MSTKHIENKWYCITVKSESFHDIDQPWDWCIKNIGPMENWTFDVSNVPGNVIDYYFESKEDAVKFKLTWG